MNRFALLAACTSCLLAACTFHPSGDEDRADLTTGSHIPKKYPPGSMPSDVQVVKPTPGDNAAGSATAQPQGSRSQ